MEARDEELGEREIRLERSEERVGEMQGQLEGREAQLQQAATALETRENAAAQAASVAGDGEAEAALYAEREAKAKEELRRSELVAAQRGRTLEQAQVDARNARREVADLEERLGKQSGRIGDLEGQLLSIYQVRDTRQELYLYMLSRYSSTMVLAVGYLLSLNNSQCVARNMYTEI